MILERVAASKLRAIVSPSAEVKVPGTSMSFPNKFAVKRVQRIVKQLPILQKLSKNLSKNPAERSKIVVLA